MNLDWLNDELVDFAIKPGKLADGTPRLDIYCSAHGRIISAPEVTELLDLIIYAQSHYKRRHALVV